MRLDIKYQPLDFEVYLSQVIDIPRVSSLEQPPYTFQLEKEALEKVDQILERTKREAQELEDRIKSRGQQEQVAAAFGTIAQSTIDNAINRIDIETSDTIDTTQALKQATNYETLDDPPPSQQQIPLGPPPHLQQMPTVALPPTTDITIPLVPTNSTTKTPLLPVPSCPTETPLTPIKSDLATNDTTNNTDLQQNQQQQQSQETVGTNNLNRVNPIDFEEINYNPFDHLELQTIDELRELNLVFQASYANQANINSNQLQPNAATEPTNIINQDNSNAITKS